MAIEGGTGLAVLLRGLKEHVGHERIEADLLAEGDLLRHDPSKLAAAVLALDSSKQPLRAVPIPASARVS